MELSNGVNLSFKTLRKSGWIYETFQLKLPLPELLFQSALLNILRTKLIEYAVIDIMKINGEYQNGHNIKNNKKKAKSRPHSE